MLFICGLLFLKKRVTVVVNGQQPASVSVSNVDGKPAAAVTPHHADNALNKPHNAKPTDATTSEQYDFYTMLPKMQVKEAPSNVPASATPAPTPKPTKPLASAEQAMLAPQTSNSNPSTATTAPSAPTTANETSTAEFEAPAPADTAPQAIAPVSTPTITTTTAGAPATPPPTPKYVVVAGSANSASEADALRAQLVLNGVDHIHLKKVDDKYLVIIGKLYSNKADATKAAQVLSNNGVNATITPLS